MNQQYAPATSPPEKACSICLSAGHSSDACPALQEDDNAATPQAYAVNIYDNRPLQNLFGRDCPDYLGWRDNPNVPPQ